MGLEGIILIPKVSPLQITSHCAKVLGSKGFIHHLFPTTHQSSEDFSALHKKILHETPKKGMGELCHGKVDRSRTLQGVLLHCCSLKVVLH